MSFNSFGFIRLNRICTARKLGQGNIFRSVCPHSVHRGACVVALWGRAWLICGGMRGCSEGAFMVAPGGMHGCSRGAGVVALGGVRGCSGGMHGCSGGHAWLLHGGRHGCSGGACVVALGGVCHCSGGHAWDMMRYGDTVNEWAVHILLECILVNNKLGFQMDTYRRYVLVLNNIFSSAHFYSFT